MGPAAVLVDQVDGVAGVPVAEPTSIGQAIIGFVPEKFPAVEPGSSLLGHEVQMVEPRGAYVVVAAQDLMPLRAAAAQRDDVLYVEDDVLVTASIVPDDSRYHNQYGPAQMGAETAWDEVGYGTDSIIVAVLDTGIRRTHEDLTGGRVLQGYDYIENDSNPQDDCGHGTHVAGTVGATTDNGVGVAGMAQATILPLKVLAPSGNSCSGPMSGVNAAIYDATDDGADIISMSLGTTSYSSSNNNAVNYAWNRDVIVVAAAGNGGSTDGVNYPAANDNAIAVANINSNKQRASSSDRGPEVEISAAGTSILSTVENHDGAYAYYSGTSMATPHVAGAFALAMTCAPGASNSVLRDLMQSTAEDLGSSGRDTGYGYGLMRIDTMVAELGCGPGGQNLAPELSFEASEIGMTVEGDASGSYDPDGDVITITWDWGDGSVSHGLTATHTYATPATYTVTVTASDGFLEDSATQKAYIIDPNVAPAHAPENENGKWRSYSISQGEWKHIALYVPGDASYVIGYLDGPNCRFATCGRDVDLYMRRAALPTGGNYDCRSNDLATDENCRVNNPKAGWWYISARAPLGDSDIRLRGIHDGTVPNRDPTAAFTATISNLDVSVDASDSSDRDGDELSYSWTWGDGATATGESAAHTYAADGTYTITLTADDGRGGIDVTSLDVEVELVIDPDPSTPNLDPGVQERFAMDGGNRHFKVYVPEGSDRLRVTMEAANCGRWCTYNADLYVRKDSRATNQDYDCLSNGLGDDEVCHISSPATGWWYVRVRHIVGTEQTIKLTALV